MEKFKFDKKTNSLFKAMLSLQNTKEMEKFFRDLCTLDEIRDMSDRWQIACMLDKGISYREIAKKLEVSTTTVSRVALWLNNGEGGYELALKRTNTHHKTSCKKRF